MTCKDVRVASLRLPTIARATAVRLNSRAACFLRGDCAHLANGFCVYFRVVFSLVCAVLVTATRAVADDATVENYYRSVLVRMNALPQAALVSYEAVARASGAQFYVSRDPATGEAEFGFSVGSALGDTDERWPVIVRTADDTTSVRLTEAYARTRFPALNATWGGIDSWMRFGMQEPALPSTTAEPAVTPQRASSAPPVIAVVRSLGLSVYRVSDAGMTTCDGGAPARRLRLTPRDDRSHHPATDLAIDTASGLICTIRFQIEHSDLVDRDGYVELHLASVGRYYLVTRGEISFTSGYRLGRQFVRLFLDYIGMAFPQAAPAGAFAARQRL